MFLLIFSFLINSNILINIWWSIHDNDRSENPWLDEEIAETWEERKKIGQIAMPALSYLASENEVIFKEIHKRSRNQY